MIRKKPVTPVLPIVVDLTGTRGNAFFLMGMAQDLARKMGHDRKYIASLLEKMMSSDYEALLQTFDEEFGDFVILER